MIATKKHFVNTHRRNFNKYTNPSPDAIPDLWRELSTLATLVPAGEAGGVHRLRSRLLDAVEPWRLPEVLDSLTTEGAYA